jgi:23S rRNA pseudouridine1911/1915/1917 synthase
MTASPELVYEVPPEQEGWRLRSVLLTGMHLSRRLLSKLKREENSLLVNGVRIPLHTLMRAGDQVIVRLPEEVSGDIMPQPMPIEIIHEDEHLFIVNKEAGRIVHPTSGHYLNTIANGVVHLWQSRGEDYRFRPIHRLDQDTSGVLAIAKNGYAHQYVSAQFQEGHVSKTYLAIVHGLVKQDQGIVEGPIDRDPDEPHVRIVTPTGYPSTTRFETLERFSAAGASLVRLKPVTGRTHQIRVHMKHLGHPLVGDSLYAREINTPLQAMIPRQALHAADLSFRHPGTGERVVYEAPLPQDMAELLRALREVR